MLLLTTTELPEGLLVKQVFNLVIASQPILISRKTIGQSISGLLSGTGNSSDEWADALHNLATRAPSAANAIIGIQCSTATQTFNNGTYLYLTLIGTPVTCESSVEKHA